ncbi:L-histidine N(alpha)-methyltransferase [Candidatus Woesearchaeota archaeon]|nr:L-histidine N(alpha)-methyltransferase [Candidatus Woesearchaeota archaeon]
MFIRSKRVKGRVYYQLVENKRVRGKLVQRVLKHLGNEHDAQEYCRKHRLPFTKKATRATDSAFFSPRQSSEFITAVRGRNEIPLKFEYLREGARRWDALVRSKGYSLGFTESEMLTKHAQDIINTFTSRFNVIDIGCGNGEKAQIILKGISGFRPKYAALDISPEMLGLAENNITKELKTLNAEFHTVDFEEGNFANITQHLREKNYPNNLFLFLGNTVGNVPDKSRILSNIRESMTVKDFLLIGIEMFDLSRIQDVLAHYHGNKVWRNIIFTTLEHCGLHQDDGAFEVTFNKNKSQVEARFILKTAKELKYGERTIRFRKGEKILLMISYKSTPKNIQILLAETGFMIHRLFLNEREDYALILCKPMRW